MPNHTNYYVALLSSILICSPTLALEYSANLDISAEHSDNILLSKENKQSDTERRALINFALKEHTKTIQANIDYSAEYYDYKDDLIEDESVIEGTAKLDWAISPQAFNWNFTTSTQNLRRDRKETDILSNSERRNIFSTGPTFSYRASSVDTANLSIIYTDTQFKETDASDNNRTSGNLFWNHKQPGNREFTTGISYAETDFDDITVPDIERTSAYIGYTSSFTNTQWSVKAGYNKSKQDASEDVDGPLLEASINYRSDKQEFSLIAINLITDSTIGLGDSSSIIDGDMPDDDSNFTEIDIVERSHLDIRYTNHSLCSVCTLDGFIVYDDQDFHTLDNDEESVLVGLGFAYKFTQNLNTELRLSRETIKFYNTDRDDDVDRALIRVNYTVLPQLTVYLSFRNEQRSSNQVLAEYDESRSGLGLNYTF
jgi:hypothetical protein